MAGPSVRDLARLVTLALSLQLRLAVVEALGPMSYLMPGEKLEEQLPKLIPGILALYKKHTEAFYISKVSGCGVAGQGPVPSPIDWQPCQGRGWVQVGPGFGDAVSECQRDAEQQLCLSQSRSSKVVLVLTSLMVSHSSCCARLPLPFPCAISSPGGVMPRVVVPGGLDMDGVGCSPSLLPSPGTLALPAHPAGAHSAQHASS